MNKILVILHVPALNEQFEVLLPSFLTVEETILLLSEALSDLSQKRFVKSTNTLLCVAGGRTPLSFMNTVRECGIQQGDHLYML